LLKTCSRANRLNPPTAPTYDTGSGLPTLSRIIWAAPARAARYDAVDLPRSPENNIGDEIEVQLQPALQ
jgi:hypothetical protein